MARLVDDMDGWNEDDWEGEDESDVLMQPLDAAAEEIRERDECMRHPQQRDQFLVKLEVVATQGANTVTAHKRTLDYLKYVLKFQYKAKVAAVSTDVARQTEVLVVFVPEGNVIPMQNAIVDDTFLRVLNETYETVVADPDVPFRLMREVPPRICLLSFARDHFVWPCCAGVFGQSAYASMGFGYIKSQADLAPCDPEGKVWAILHPPPAPPPLVPNVATATVAPASGADAEAPAMTDAQAREDRRKKKKAELRLEIMADAALAEVLAGKKN
jgi:hypothetical protein